MTDLKIIYEAYLRELLLKLSLEASKSINVSFFDVADMDNVLRDCLSCENDSGVANVEVRIFRRQTNRPTRFKIQAMSNDLSPETGYSGFVANGRLTVEGEVEITDRTNMYNVDGWESKLELSL